MNAPPPPIDPDLEIVTDDPPSEWGVSVVTAFHVGESSEFTESQVVAMCHISSRLFAEVLTEAVHDGSLHFTTPEAFLEDMSVHSKHDQYLWALEERLNALKPNSLVKFEFRVLWAQPTFALHLVPLFDTGDPEPPQVRH